MTGTPVSRSGTVAKTRKSGSVWTWTSANRRREWARVSATPDRTKNDRYSRRYDRERCALVALDAEPADVDAGDGLALGVRRSAEGEDLDG